jgi:hypothetical protein
MHGKLIGNLYALLCWQKNYSWKKWLLHILLLLNSEMVGRHPQFPLLESFCHSKHPARLIAEEGAVTVDNWFYLFYWFLYYVVAHGANIFVLLLCSIAFAATQDMPAQPPNLGWLVGAVHTSCRVPAACSALYPRSAADGLHRVDDTCGPMVSRDPHIPPFVWQDHGDTVGRRHDRWSSHRRNSYLWAGVPGGGTPSERLSAFAPFPWRPRGSEGQENDEHSLRVAHSSLEHRPGGCWGRRHLEVCSVLCLAYGWWVTVC